MIFWKSTNEFLVPATDFLGDAYLVYLITCKEHLGEGYGSTSEKVL